MDIHTISIVTVLYFIVILLIYLGGEKLRNIIAGFGVPNVASSSESIQTLLKIIKLKKGDIFVDLGAGEGKVVANIAHGFPNNICIGYELAPKAYNKAIIYRQSIAGEYKILNQNFFKADLSKATHIYCYLMPHLMHKVWKKLRKECKPGTKLYINAFPIPQKSPETKIGTIHIYTL